MFVDNNNYSQIAAIALRLVFVISFQTKKNIKNEQKVGMLLQKRADTRGVGISNTVHPRLSEPHWTSCQQKVRISEKFGKVKYMYIYVTCKMHAVLQCYFLTYPLFGRCVEFPSLSLSTIVHLTRAEYHNNSHSHDKMRRC